ncbi:hypothetical protein DVH05_008636 [Phytophthora capsici]|nr:hypothetical protein DVH05_008636 [Phytophthora capsici]
MLGSAFGAKIDKRLRVVYNPDLPFGDKSILWAGDFLQLEALMGTPLCRALYKLNQNAILIQARDLMRRFRVFFLNSQQRAHDCPEQQKILDAFRTLPLTYPDDSSSSGCQQLSDEVIDAVTTELTATEVMEDPAWLDEATVLVTSNIDKAALTACAAKLLASRTDTVVFRWKKPVPNFPKVLLDLLYVPKDYPNLFGYFVRDGPAQILDNGNGNVEWGVANGTMCKLASLAWSNDGQTDHILNYLANLSVQSGDEIDLPIAPDFINVTLTRSNGEVIPATSWPPENNLETNWELNSSGRQLHKKSIIIPIGLVANKQLKYGIKLARALLPKPIEVKYSQLAVELALVMTVWKAQGATLRRVLLFLEGTPGAHKWL